MSTPLYARQVRSRVRPHTGSQVASSHDANPPSHAWPLGHRPLGLGHPQSARSARPITPRHLLEVFNRGLELLAIVAIDEAFFDELCQGWDPNVRDGIQTCAQHAGEAARGSSKARGRRFKSCGNSLNSPAASAAEPESTSLAVHLVAKLETSSPKGAAAETTS